MAVTILAEIEEGTTGIYTAILKDEAGVALTALPVAARLSYYSVVSATIVNSRSNQNVLNANNVTITAAGLLTWKLQEADVILVDTPKPALVRHRAEFVIEWNDAAAVPRQVGHVVELPIRALVKAPFAA